MNKQIVNGAIGLGFAFIAFLGSQLYIANNDIVRLNQAMKLLVDDHMQIIPSPENALERGRIESRVKVNVVLLDELEDKVKDLKQEIKLIEIKIESLR
jgi:hypothetical protein